VSDLPIGVFDSGVGGLTVLKALRAEMPGEHFIYLGDTARLPYGTKSAQTVSKYALRAAGTLVERGIKALVVACNTASAVALPALTQAHAPMPVIGVVHPGAEAAVQAARLSGHRHIRVLATESTLRGGAYVRALLERDPSLIVTQRACPLLVTLAEEGRTEDHVTRTILEDYLGTRTSPATLLLGCTHFPVFRTELARIWGETGNIIDSAKTTAAVVKTQLARNDLLLGGSSGTVALLATDDQMRFRRVGRYFLDEPISSVEIVDL
jgi:glutamate racemase